MGGGVSAASALTAADPTAPVEPTTAIDIVKEWGGGGGRGRREEEEEQVVRGQRGGVAVARMDARER